MPDLLVLVSVGNNQPSRKPNSVTPGWHPPHVCTRLAYLVCSCFTAA